MSWKSARQELGNQAGAISGHNTRVTVRVRVVGTEGSGGCEGCAASGRFSAPRCMRYRARAVGGGEEEAGLTPWILICTTAWIMLPFTDINQAGRGPGRTRV